jgi:glutathione synthase/RimK-type ligase-like ATP-grasp enzyme
VPEKSGVAQTIEYLRHMEKPHGSLNSSRIVNGSRAAEIFSSRTRQLAAIAAAGLPFPRTHVVSSIGQLLKACSNLSFPILLKGNQPHTPVFRFETEEALIQAYLQDTLIATNEHTWLIQECIPPKGNHIVRIETLNGRFLYAVKLYITGNQQTGWPLQAKVEAFTPDPELILAAETLARTALVDFGAVEYLTDRRNNDVLFFSIRPHTSSFSTPAVALHTKPFERIADYLEGRLSKVKEIALAI